MAVIVKTNDPFELMQHILEYIDENKIRTWDYDDQCRLTHTGANDHWRGKAWLLPRVVTEPVSKLVLNIVRGNVPPTWELYGVFQGRIIEQLLGHFHDRIEGINPTVKPTSNDKFPLR